MIDNKQLKKIFKEQKEFQKNFYDPDNMTTEEKISYSKEFILCAHRELGEILNILPWKSYRNLKSIDVNLDELKEEIIDSFKFLLNLCIIWEMTADDFVTLFFEKSKIVRKRYKNEFKKINVL